MKTLHIILSLIALSFSGNILAQSEEKEKPTIQDLSFLIGTWEISFEFYDTHDPDRGIVFTETGTQTCVFDLPLNGVPMFITCTGEVESNKGRKRTFRESIRYGNFVKTFERTGIYSNWPATAREIMYYHPDERKLEIWGELDVQNGMLERYEDIYLFSEDYSSYQRTNIANFSDMSPAVYNLTLKGSGLRIKD